ncbi:uncharacterized protein LOC144294746 [Canis aureus]
MNTGASKAKKGRSLTSAVNGRLSGRRWQERGSFECEPGPRTRRARQAQAAGIQGTEPGATGMFKGFSSTEDSTGANHAQGAEEAPTAQFPASVKQQLQQRSLG